MTRANIDAEDWKEKWSADMDAPDAPEDVDERGTYKTHFTLPSGREVYVARLQMALTYAGCMEGGNVSNSRFIRRRLVKSAQEKFAPDQKVVCIDEGGRALPGLQWFAKFTSHRRLRTDDSDYDSQLCLCWFSNDLPNDLNAFLGEVLTKINWEEDAEDYSIMF